MSTIEIPPWLLMYSNPKQGVQYDYIIPHLKAEKFTAELQRQLLHTFSSSSQFYLHPYLKRDLVCSHRAFDTVLKLQSKLMQDKEKKQETGRETAQQSSLELAQEALTKHQRFELERQEKRRKKKHQNIYEAKTPEALYLYTGCAVSTTQDSLHLGNIIPLLFSSYMQQLFQCACVIQLSDDQSFFSSNFIPKNLQPTLSTAPLGEEELFSNEIMDAQLEQLRQQALANAKQIIACGFDVDRTFMFRNTDYAPYMYANVLRAEKNFLLHKTKSLLGLQMNQNVGSIAFSAVEIAPCYYTSFPHIFNSDYDFERKDDYAYSSSMILSKQGWKPASCLIPCCLDQDVYFDITKTSAYPDCSLVHMKIPPGLRSPHEKMTDAYPDFAIFLSDDAATIQSKFKELRQPVGSAITNNQSNIPLFYIDAFHSDNEFVERLHQGLISSQVGFSKLKEVAAQTVIQFVEQHNKKVSQVSNEQVKTFMTKRKLKTE